MKKTLLLFVVTLISFISFSQVDSSYLKAGKLQVQARDFNLIATFIKSNTEQLFDSVKLEYRGGNKPSNSTIVIIDSVEIGELINVYQYAGNLPLRLSEQPGSRIRAAIKAISNNYLQKRITEIDTKDNSEGSALKQSGEALYERKRN